MEVQMSFSTYSIYTVGLYIVFQQVTVHIKYKVQSSFISGRIINVYFRFYSEVSVPIFECYVYCF